MLLVKQNKTLLLGFIAGAVCSTMIFSVVGLVGKHRMSAEQGFVGPPYVNAAEKKEQITSEQESPESLSLHEIKTEGLEVDFVGPPVLTASIAPVVEIAECDAAYIAECEALKAPPVVEVMPVTAKAKQKQASQKKSKPVVKEEVMGPVDDTASAISVEVTAQPEPTTQSESAVEQEAAEPPAAEPEPVETPASAPVKSYNGVSEGDVLHKTVQSHYCACSKCNGPAKNGGFYTFTGKRVWNGMDNPRIIACNWLPMGSVVEIGGVQYTVEDKGGAKRLYNVGTVDVFVPEGHAFANKKGLIKDVPMKIISIAI